MTAHTAPDTQRTASALVCSVLTWPAILALDEAALNATIDQVIYGYTWSPVQQGDSEPRDWWQCLDEPGVLVTRSCVPYHQHTASWDRTMALMWRGQLTLQPYWQDGSPPSYAGWAAVLQWAIPRPALQKGWPYRLACTTEAEARVALCRLALWQALVQHGTRKERTS